MASIKTEGLSIKYLSESDLRNLRNYILLDSVGFEMPLLDYKKIKEIKSRRRGINSTRIHCQR